MKFSLHVAPTAVLVAILLLFAASSGSFAADAPGGPAADDREELNLFDAMESGEIEVRLIVKDGQRARIVTRNKTDRPLTIKIPEAFAAIPVLAQGQGGGGGPAVFNLPPEKVTKTDVGFICLEHGKPDPRSTMQYKIRPVGEITKDQRIVELLREFGNGRYSHAAAQAAAWHMQNNMSWEQLARKIRRNLTGIKKPYFSSGDLRQAAAIVAQVTHLAQQRPQQQQPPDRYQGTPLDATQ